MNVYERRKSLKEVTRTVNICRNLIMFELLTENRVVGEEVSLIPLILIVVILLFLLLLYWL